MRPLVHEAKARQMHGSAFIDKVRAVADALGFPADWLMAVMKSESGFDPSIRNPLPGQTATGLIQFVESTARSMGTTTAALASMSAVRQMDYVQTYYEATQASFGRITQASDLYLATFYPVAIGKPSWFKLGKEVSRSRVAAVAAANKGIDLNENGVITKGEFKRWIKKRGIFEGIINPMNPAVWAIIGTAVASTGVAYRKEIKSLFKA